jgi:SWI/SNF-related matrix-associated actin-dependent regulator of chromatin subfamily D
MTAFVQDPVGFLNKWVSSQSKDLEVVLGEGGGVNPEEARRSEFYQQDRIKEALYNYMSEREMH